MEELEQSSTKKTGLLSLPPLKSKSAEQFGVMGMITPPHHSASVPFRWEEEPGKPRSCHTQSSLSLTPFKGLDLPPRLQFHFKFTKTPSPTTVLEGPYVGSRSIFHSLRIIRHRHGSFDGGESGGSSPERASLGLSRRWLLQKRQGKKETVHQGTFVFSSFSGEEDDKKRSSLGITKPRSNFWATIYGAMKQVIPTPRRRSKTKN